MKFYENENFMRSIYNSQIDIPSINGSVLYLGMGPCWIARQQTNVNRTLIIESDQTVIDNYNHYNPGDWEIINADVYTYTTNEKFDFIMFDIWDHMVDKSVIDDLISLYSNNLNVNGQALYLQSVCRMPS